MKLLIISDTHTDSIKKLPSGLTDIMGAADAILHAGDVVGSGLIEEISRINPEVYAVKGNMDPDFDPVILPHKRELTFDGCRIGLIHGDGARGGLENRLLYEFPDAHVIVYGHTHHPWWGVIDNVRFLNPGSPTQRRNAPQHTAAWLTIDNGTPMAEFIIL